MTSSHTMNKVERACADLAHDGRPVTFAAIATATGLARSTLYLSLIPISEPTRPY